MDLLLCCHLCCSLSQENVREKNKHMNVLYNQNVVSFVWTEKFSHPGFERETVSLDLCASKNSHIHTKAIYTDQVSFLHKVASKIGIENVKNGMVTE